MVLAVVLDLETQAILEILALLELAVLKEMAGVAARGASCSPAPAVLVALRGVMLDRVQGEEAGPPTEGLEGMGTAAAVVAGEADLVPLVTLHLQEMPDPPEIQTLAAPEVQHHLQHHLFYQLHQLHLNTT